MHWTDAELNWTRTKATSATDIHFAFTQLPMLFHSSLTHSLKNHQKCVHAHGFGDSKSCLTVNDHDGAGQSEVASEMPERTKQTATDTREAAATRDDWHCWIVISQVIIIRRQESIIFRWLGFKTFQHRFVDYANLSSLVWFNLNCNW